MKKPAFKAGFLVAVLSALFIAQPVVVHAQASGFLLGEIKVYQDFMEQAEGVEASGRVLSAVSEEQPAVEAESAAQEEVPAEPQPIVVEVVRGDSLSKIATSHNTTFKRLFDANEFIADPNVINPGDKIRIPHESEVLTERAVPAPKPVAKKPSKRSSNVTGANTGAPAPSVADGSVWDRLARCESGGNWAINTGNGYYGGLQFNAGTWRSNGGEQYAPYAHLATREQQIDIAQRLHAGRGFKPWPACSRKLGLL